MPGDGVGPGSGCRIRSAVSEQGLKASVVIGKERAARTINSLVPEQPFQKWTKTYNAWWVLSPLLCGTGPIYPAQIRILGLCKWFRTHLCPEGELAKLHSFKFSLLLTVSVHVLQSAGHVTFVHHFSHDHHRAWQKLLNSEKRLKIKI